MLPLILASSSPYRRELLARLRLPFESHSPDIDETARPGESAKALVMRLSTQKALALQARFTDRLILGSDQVATLDGAILGKPLTHEKAHAQLRRASGRRVRFLTGLTLLDASSGRAQTDVATFDVSLRTLDDATIERYLRAETPYDCAGSFKAEGLGIALFERTAGTDATSLIGLPLIRLVDMLLAEGVRIP